MPDAQSDLRGNELQRWRDANAHEIKGVARLPRRLTLADFLAVVVRADPERVRSVPSSALAEMGQDGEGDYALVNCPCSHHTVVRAQLEKCSGCERYYVLEDDVVLVAYGAMTPPSRP